MKLITRLPLFSILLACLVMKGISWASADTTTSVTQISDIQSIRIEKIEIVNGAFSKIKFDVPSGTESFTLQVELQ